LVGVVGLSGMLVAGGDMAPVEIPPVEIPVEVKNFYIGVGASAMSMLNDGTDEEFTATGATVIAGYIYNEYIAIEARYSQSLTDVKYDGGTTATADNDNYPTDFTNAGVYLKPSYPIGDVSPYLLLGYGEVGLTNLPIGGSDRAESGFQWGVGVSYSVSDCIELFADYMTLYDGTGFNHLATLSDHKATLATFGVAYKF